MDFKKLEIYGFKSFADKLEVKFDDGITAIVGPNGCGKSNVADALRWVMGEQSAKSLRGSNMSELIFSGTEKRKSLSYCEVSLHFDNTNRIFKYDFNDIVLTRKLYRDGSSEYFINRTNCRLKDIQDLLRDSGLGRDGYSIIGQGKIDEILSAKPEERRAIFEEAAGITRSKVKKIEAERKLVRTRDNIEKLSITIEALRQQLEPLTKQAEVARKYLDLKERLKHFEVNNYIYQYDTASDTKAIVKKKLDGIIEELDVKTLDYNKANDSYNQAMDEMSGVDSRIEDLREEHLSVTVGIEKKAGELKLLNEKRNNLSSENTRLNEEIIALNEKFEQTTSELNYMTDKRTDKAEEAQEINTRIASLNEKYMEILNHLTEGEGAAEEHNLMVMEAMEKLTEIKANSSRLITESNALTQKQAELNKRIEAITAKSDMDSQAAQILSEKTVELKAAIDDFNKKIDELTTKYNELQSNIQKIAVEIDKQSAAIHTQQAQHNFLTQFVNDYEGYHGSVKRLLTDSNTVMEVKNRLDSVVAQVIKVSEKLEIAIETALGNALQNIITPTDNDAKFLVQYLKQKGYGRATFLPLNTVKTRSIDFKHMQKLKRIGCYGIADELIEFDPKYKSVMSGLLGSTVIVEDIEIAVKLAQDCDYSFRIVTLDGDVLAASGSVTGGSKKAEVNNILAYERNLKKIGEDLVVRKGKLEELTQKRKTLVELQKKCMDEIKKLTTAMHEDEVQFATMSEKRDKIVNGVEDAKREIFVLSQEQKAVTDRLVAINDNLNKVAEYENIIESQKSTASESRLSRRHEFDALRKNRDELHEAITKAKVSLASREAEILAISGDIGRLKQAIIDIGLNIDKNGQSIERNNEVISEIQAEMDVYESKMENNDSERAIEIKGLLSDLNKYKAEIQAKIAQSDTDRMALINVLTKLNDDKAREEFLLEKVDSDIQKMQEQILEEYELTYELCIEFKEEDYDINKGVVEINRLKRQISGLGYVNVNAIEDSKLVGAQYFELVEKRDDMLKAEADLNSIINELTKEMLVKFNEEFEKISTNFIKVFRELFGGGNARLVLLDSDNPLEAGIEIVAEPPGKKLQSIALLSGGERALTAIAILFSILKLKPMPFCVLDEIEAALDDANAQRFAKYLRRFSEQTQFIVITHRKPTMELADNLYGVTMEEKGVSKIVSVKLNEAVEVAGADLK